MPPLYEEVSKCHLFMKKFWNVMTRPTMIGWEQGSRTRYDDCWSLIIKNPCHSSRTFARWKQKWVSHRTVRMARNVSSADFTCSIMIGWGRWTMQNVVGSSAKSLEMVGVTPDCAHGECEKCRLRMLNTNDWLRWTVQNELYWRIYDLQVLSTLPADWRFVKNGSCRDRDLLQQLHDTQLVYYNFWIS